MQLFQPFCIHPSSKTLQKQNSIKSELIKMGSMVKLKHPSPNNRAPAPRVWVRSYLDSPKAENCGWLTNVHFFQKKLRFYSCNFEKPGARRLFGCACPDLDSARLLGEGSLLGDRHKYHWGYTKVQLGFRVFFWEPRICCFQNIQKNEESGANPFRGLTPVWSPGAASCRQPAGVEGVLW